MSAESSSDDVLLTSAAPTPLTSPPPPTSTPYGAPTGGPAPLGTSATLVASTDDADDVTATKATEATQSTQPAAAAATGVVPDEAPPVYTRVEGKGVDAGSSTESDGDGGRGRGHTSSSDGEIDGVTARVEVVLDNLRDVRGGGERGERGERGGRRTRNRHQGEGDGEGEGLTTCESRFPHRRKSFDEWWEKDFRVIICFCVLSVCAMVSLWALDATTSRMLQLSGDAQLQQWLNPFIEELHIRGAAISRHLLGARTSVIVSVLFSLALGGCVVATTYLRPYAKAVPVLVCVGVPVCLMQIAAMVQFRHYSHLMSWVVWECVQSRSPYHVLNFCFRVEEANQNVWTGMVGVFASHAVLIFFAMMQYFRERGSPWGWCRPTPKPRVGDRSKKYTAMSMWYADDYVTVLLIGIIFATAAVFFFAGTFSGIVTVGGVIMFSCCFCGFACCSGCVSYTRNPNVIAPFAWVVGCCLVPAFLSLGGFLAAFRYRASASVEACEFGSGDCDKAVGYDILAFCFLIAFVACVFLVCVLCTRWRRFRTPSDPPGCMECTGWPTFCDCTRCLDPEPAYAAAREV